MKQLLVIIAVAACVSGYGQQTVTISRGFFTGKEYLDMSDTERRAYATGAINGMLIAPLFGAPEERVNWLKTCSASMSDEQVAAILTRHIIDQPGRANDSLNVLTFGAMQAACSKSKPQ
jgi:hypothetical protein